MRLFFDMDGVICDGRYAGPTNRTDEMYKELPVVEGFDRDIFNTLVYDHEVYILTARSRPNSAKLIHDWLYRNLIGAYGLMGIITGVPSAFKPSVVGLMSGDLLVDDCPQAIRPLKTRGLLYHNEPYNGTDHDLTRAFSWQEIDNYVSYLGRTYEHLNPSSANLVSACK